MKEPTKETKSFISNIFKAYSNYKKDDRSKKKDASEFCFSMDDFVLKNLKMPDYLKHSADDPSLLDPNIDFYLKTECFFMAEEEVKGILILKRDTLDFHQVA